MGDEPVEEAGSVLLVVAEGAQQGEDAETALARHTGAGGDVLAGLVLDVELHPLAAVRVDGALHELVLGEVAQTEPLTGLEDHAGAAHELRHDHALGAVDDERPLVGHDREVAHEHRLLFDLAGVAVHEAGAHEHRRAVGHVLFLALLHRELRRRTQILVERVELQLEPQRLGEVLDRADVPERVRQALVQEPFEALALDGDQVGELERLLQIAERIPVAGDRASRHGSHSKVVTGGWTPAAKRARSTVPKEEAGRKMGADAAHGNVRPYRRRARIVNHGRRSVDQREMPPRSRDVG